VVQVSSNAIFLPLAEEVTLNSEAIKNILFHEEILRWVGDHAYLKKNKFEAKRIKLTLLSKQTMSK
jgi:hypothetical protein